MSAHGVVVRTRALEKVFTPEERRLCASAWREIRGVQNHHGVRGSISIFLRVPALAPSLESLVEQGYGISDIALMFGAGTSTVAKWLKTLGLRSIHVRYPARMWDPVSNRFIPTKSIGVTSWASSLAQIQAAKNRPRSAHWNHRKTHCKHGHAFTAENTCKRDSYHRHKERAV